MRSSDLASGLHGWPALEQKECTPEGCATAASLGREATPNYTGSWRHFQMRSKCRAKAELNGFNQVMFIVHGIWVGIKLCFRSEIEQKQGVLHELDTVDGCSCRGGRDGGGDDCRRGSQRKG